MKNKVKKFRDWLKTIPPLIVPVEPIKPLPPVNPLTIKKILSCLISLIISLIPSLYISLQCQEMWGDNTLVYGFLITLLTFLLCWWIFCGWFIYSFKKKHSNEWEQYTNKRKEYRIKLSEYTTAFIKYQQDYEAYSSEITLREKAENYISKYEQMLSVIGEYGLNQASIELRSVLSEEMYKEFLCEYFGPSAVFQYEQLQSQKIQTQAAILTAENSERAANAATVAAGASVATAYNTHQIRRLLEP